jgi:general nucleoside transport system permease protein
VIARAETPRRLTWDATAIPRYVAYLGIALGALAFWVALPPMTVRTNLWPIALAVAAVALGAWAVFRGVGRPAWFAIATGILGGPLGVLAIRSSETKLEEVVVWSALLAAMLRFATPLVFAAIGGMFSERSGVVNIGLEGMMLAGAFFAILGADKLESWPLGILCAMAAGGILALIHAFVSIHLRADQIVSGTAVNFLALGVTGYFFVDVYAGQGSPTDIPRVPTVDIAFDTIPGGFGEFVDDILGDMSLLIWLSFVVLILSYIVMFRTPFGLRVRAVGEHPRAAETVGISVYAMRYVGVTVSGILAALGGAYLSLGFVGSFSENMTAGRGFIALAALIVGRWRPLGTFVAALLFGFSTALAPRLAVYSPSGAVLFEALPYVLTLIAVAGVIGRSIPPAAVGRPYTKQ